MKLSQLFTKTRREAPSEEVSLNAKLLIQAGFIHKELAGAYDYLPLGLVVLKKIEQIIREEINAIDGQEVLMTALQNPELWERTGRWSDRSVDIWFKSKLKNNAEVGLGWTHEEPLTELLKQFVSSYRDLPFYVYQFQTKFRNELRAKSGILRGREFLMKDLYSFSRTQEEHDEYYEKVKNAYFKIFKRVGVGEVTYLTYASGGSFSKFSHEFQALTEAGEDTIYLDEKKGLAVNHEVYEPELLQELGLKDKDLKKRKAIEVGNIFSLGTKFSDPLGLKFKSEEGKDTHVIMGCYGLGLGRLMGTIAEVHHDERGIIWPEAIAPARVYIVGIGEKGKKEAEKFYETAVNKNIEAILDDRDTSPGDSFATADLLGIPYRVVFSDKTLAKKGAEIKERRAAEGRIEPVSKILAELKKLL